MKNPVNTSRNAAGSLDSLTATGFLSPNRPAGHRLFRFLLTLTLILGILIPLTAVPLFAQASNRALVSNLAKTSIEGGNVRQQQLAQKFTTGNHSTGYFLQNIQLSVYSRRISRVAGNNPRYIAELWSVANNGQPSARIKTLTLPQTLPMGTVTFSAPANTLLEPNTSYFMVFGQRVGALAAIGGNVAETEDKGEDAGKAAGWSIANDQYYRNQGNSWNWRRYTTSVIKIQVNGRPAPLTTYSITPTVSVDEGGEATLTVTLGQAAPSFGFGFNVNYDYRGGDASSSDTELTPNYVSVQPRATTAELKISISHDALVEAGESFKVRITPDGAVSGWTVTPGRTDTATVTINDEDTDSAKIAFG